MAGMPVSDLAGMLAGMAPALHPDPWRFVVVEGGLPAPDTSSAFALIREDEGTTAIIRDTGIRGAGAQSGQGGGAFARITLMVHSALEGVGLTAAVATALAGAGIACNVVAGFHHDHLFVPWDRRDEALEILQRLARAG